MSSNGGETIDINGNELIGLDVVENQVSEAAQATRTKEMAIQELGIDIEASPMLGVIEEGPRPIASSTMVSANKSFGICLSLVFSLAARV
ncbi:unnamed protein product [Ilex paraguariensis]|uniref:Uncharacterized protein n=1 Tax=Ilex paraguariensis TaxID=185542 RepID=A0ABC8R9D3_9AQUA